jgi:hypothetical protein
VGVGVGGLVFRRGEKLWRRKVGDGGRKDGFFERGGWVQVLFVGNLFFVGCVVLLSRDSSLDFSDLYSAGPSQTSTQKDVVL